MNAQRIDRGRSRRRRGSVVAGFTLVEVAVTVSLLTVAICTAALVSARGVVQSRHAGIQADARAAAALRVNGALPASDGGSVAPAAPVAGWSEVLAVDSRTGALAPVSGELPEGTVPVRVQWKAATSGGVRTFSVSSELLDADGSSPLAASRGGATYVLNRVGR